MTIIDSSKLLSLILVNIPFVVTGLFLLNILFPIYILYLPAGLLLIIYPGVIISHFTRERISKEFSDIINFLFNSLLIGTLFFFCLSFLIFFIVNIDVFVDDKISLFNNLIIIYMVIIFLLINRIIYVSEINLNLNSNFYYILIFLSVFFITGILRTFYVSFFSFWSDRFSYPFFYNLQGIVNNFSYIQDPVEVNTVSPIMTAINPISRYFIIYLSNAIFIIFTKSDYNVINHFPLITSLFFSLSLGKFTLEMNEENQKVKNLSVFISVIIGLFAPDAFFLISLNPTAGGLNFLSGFTFAAIIFGLFLFKSLNKENFDLISIISKNLFFFLLSVALPFVYRTEAIIFYILIIILLTQCYLSKNSKFKLTPFFSIFISIILFDFFVNFDNQFVPINLLPFINFPHNLIVLYLVYFLILFIIKLLLINRIRNKSINANQILEKVSIFLNKKRVYYFEFLIFTIFTLIFLISRIIIPFLTSENNFVNFQLYGFSDVTLLRIIEYLIIILPIMIFLNKHLIINDKNKLNFIVNFFLKDKYIISYILVLVAIFLFSFISVGMFFAFSRMIFYSFFYLIPLSSNSLVKLLNKPQNLSIKNQTNKLKIKIHSSYLIFIFISSIYILSCFIVYPPTIKNTGTITNNELDDLIELKSIIKTNDYIFTDLRLSNGLISILNHKLITLGSGVTRGTENQVNSIWFSENSTQCYSFVKYLSKLSSPIKYIMLSKEFLNLGPVIYDFFLSPLSNAQFGKFYNEIYFKLGFSGRSILLFQVVDYYAV
jgi:hypothetical protein